MRRAEQNVAASLPGGGSREVHLVGAALREKTDA